MKRISKQGLSLLLVISVFLNLAFYIYGQSLTNEIDTQREEYSDLNAQYQLLQSEYQELQESGK